MIETNFDFQYLWTVVLGVIVTGIGSVVLVFSLFRWKQGGILLLTFGSTCTLYGIRLLISIQLSQLTVGAPHWILPYLNSFITYILVIPLSAFLLQLFGRGWKNSMLWVFRLSCLFTFAGFASDIIQAIPFSLMRLNNILVIIWSFVVVGNAFWSGWKLRRDMWIVLIGFMIFGLLAVNENLISLEVLPWQWRNELLGFLVFLIAIGYVAINKFFVNEKQLISINQEMETARQIQFSILPSKMPSIEGLDIAARYIPMTAVAGDFYDVVYMDKRQLTILIADVSGHGVGAALIASMIKVAFESQSQYMSNPSYVIDAMNRLLYKKMGSAFATIGCLFIDVVGKTIIYSGAGHPPLILWRKAERKMFELIKNGLVIGPFADAKYSNIQMQIKSGDRIIMYTDGIIEARNKLGVFFGDESFKLFIKTNGEIPTEHFADLFLDYLFMWSGKKTGESQSDDITMVVIDIH